jgi:hypothetical protein
MLACSAPAVPRLLQHLLGRAAQVVAEEEEGLSLPQLHEEAPVLLLLLLLLVA